MWSGPRNISTALMRSFENRPDCAVVDEPLYGYYLQQTGLDHPVRDEIVAAMDCDWSSVAHSLVTGAPGDCPVYYQKHMTQHLLADTGLEWVDLLQNCFLIREPRRIIASYVKVRPEFVLEELGFPQQLALFERESERLGRVPPVLDAALTLANPEGVLRALCRELDIPFYQQMLHWPAGRRSSDGVWAPHWYEAVERSTGFSAAPPMDGEPVVIPARYTALCEEAERMYMRLAEHALVGNSPA